MSRRWLIVADDLTGAADCAIAFARRGVGSAVGWGGGADGPDRPPVFSYDADSRNLTADAAANRHAETIGRLLEDRTLFKKIDSTLRGQPAAETAAAIAKLRLRSGPTFGVFAPAFPGTGRTTVGGRVRVAGRPLEEAEVWKRDHSYRSADLVEILAGAGVAGELVPLAAIRGGAMALKSAFAEIATRGDVVAVCDAETEGDLRAIAAASLPASASTFFIGSAGLAHALAEADPATARPGPIELEPSPCGSLIVVGSLAAVSRSAAKALLSGGGAIHVPAEPEALLNGEDGRARIGRHVAESLRAGEDVVVEIIMEEGLDMKRGPRLVEALARTLEPAAACMGAFAATGGETAAALLSRFGVDGIRLVDEIEPGVALGLTLGGLSVPVVTKAGAFGDERSLIRIAERLRAVRTEGTFA